MYKSKEIRWFRYSMDRNILNWFTKLGQTFESIEPRTDYYLPLNKEEITVKLREGNIEIKHRVGEIIKGNLTHTTQGYFENWIRWSFKADEADNLSQQITQENLYNWTETIKTRVGMKVTKDARGNLQILPIKTFVDFGCQLEYTHLVIANKTYYTFALEWFGNEYLELDSNFIIEILGHTGLDVSDSMGYGKFINKIQELNKQN